MSLHGILNGTMGIMIVIMLTNLLLLPQDRHMRPQDAPVLMEEQTIPQRPLRLRIPAHGIDAPVEPVGLTERGNMDIPQSAFSVGWYEHGFVPGDTGNAVLAGHRDTALGTPGIFWALSGMQPGEIIVVETENGPLKFRVTRTEAFPYDRAPMQEIFGAASGRYLNLITCIGQWNRQTYDRRLVIFAELMQPEKKTLPIL